MDILDHHKKFHEIVKRCGLESQAVEISEYLTSHKEITPDDFAIRYSLSVEDAKIFLEFIKRGIEFRENR